MPGVLTDPSARLRIIYTTDQQQYKKFALSQPAPHLLGLRVKHNLEDIGSLREFSDEGPHDWPVETCINLYLESDSFHRSSEIANSRLARNAE